MGKDRVILHCDCNSFYASVELLKHPELRALPVAVAGSEDMRHGIILAKNEEAKKYNIKTAETVWLAKKKCPSLILLKPHSKEYSKYSKIINSIYADYSDRVEPFGIDESWIDVSGSWHLFANSPFDLAEQLRERIKNELGLTVSIGVSFNKIFSKLGSDYKKPDACTEIKRENYKEIIWPLPADRLLFVGSKARDSLKEIGIETIGHIAAADESLLVQILGKQGSLLFKYANGDDNSPVLKIGESEPIKSVGNGLTFRRNLLGHDDIKKGVNYLADEVAGRLRKYKLFTSAVQVIIKNPQLKSISRQKALPYSSNLAKDISSCVMELISDNWDFNKPVRMITVTAMQLSDVPYAVQTNLFSDAQGMDDRQLRLENSVDKIRNKFGKTAILSGALLHNDIGVEKNAVVDDDDDIID